MPGIFAASAAFSGATVPMSIGLAEQGMRISVIINKDGGTIRQSDPEAVRASVSAALAAGGHDADVALLPAADVRDAIRRRSPRAWGPSSSAAATVR